MKKLILLECLLLLCASCGERKVISSSAPCQGTSCNAQPKPDPVIGQPSTPPPNQPQNPNPNPDPNPTIPTKGTVGQTEVEIDLTTGEFTNNSVKQLLSTYCDGNYYQFAGETLKCSRAPFCKTPDHRGPDGGDYDRLNKEEFKPDHTACLDVTDKKGCDGYIPYCCYMMAATGDFTKCVGYWERLWCSKSLCDQAVANGASDSQCGGCMCGHAFKSYCGEDKNALTLYKRTQDLGIFKAH